MKYLNLFVLSMVCFQLMAGDPGRQSLKQALQDIEKSYNVRFNYDEALMQDKQVTDNYRETAKLSDQLAIVLEPHHLMFKSVDDKTFVIVQREGNDHDEVAPITVSGNVKDNTGMGLPGVAIVEKGTGNGTISDIEGNYSIEVDENAVLEFSFVGYKPMTVNVAGRNVIDISMEEDVQALDEVVVIGYGSVLKSDLTGALSSVSSEEITKVATTSLDQALQGRAAGVQVRQVTGMPGGGTSIRIRGTGSILAGNEPLYVIDGMMITSDGNQMSSGGSSGPKLNPLASINPNDIESIEILKDASATAIYGARGSNGVVLVTTKSGKQGQSTISVDSYYGIQEVRKTLDLLNGEQFATLINEVNADKGFPLDPDYLVPEEFGEGTDWQDAIFRTAPIQSHQISFAGGQENSSYLISGGYFNQEGIIVGSEFERINLRLNLKQKMSERINVGTNVGISRIFSKGVLTNNGTLLPGVSQTAVLFPPTQPVLDPNVPGGYTYEDNRRMNKVNPYADAVEVDDNTMNLRIIGTVYATYEIIDNLTYKLNLGVDVFSTKENRYVPNFLRRTALNNGEAVVATSNGGNWLIEHTLSYNKTFGKHKLDAVVGFTSQKFVSENLSAFTLGFNDNKTGYYAIQNGINPQPGATSVYEWGLVSYLGRINYIFNDKYLITVNGRIDGSSKFGKNNKYGVFPSGSFAWRVSDENFWAKNRILTSLKSRISYGVIGNSEIGIYQSIPIVDRVGEGTFNNTEPYNGFSQVGYPDPNLKWERANQMDVGLDLEFWSGRIALTTDYYYRLTSDLLLNNEIPTTTGFSQSTTNVGSVVNRGLEIALNSANIDNNEFSWSTNFNISFNSNEVKDIASENDVFLAGALFLPPGWSILREGEPIGTFFGYQTDGIFQSDTEIANGPLLSAQINGNTAKPGDRRFKDQGSRDAQGNLTSQPDGIINEADRVILGNAYPDFFYGITNNFKYKGFDFSFFIQGSQGNDVVNVGLFELAFLNGETNVLEEYYVNAWSDENPTQEYPRINPDANSKSIFSDAYVEDGSFARLQNVTLGYSFPPGILDRLKIRKLRVYFSGNNPVTLTKYSGFDPEVNAFGNSTLYQGADYGGYPTAKSFITGLQLTF